MKASKNAESIDVASGGRADALAAAHAVTIAYGDVNALSDVSLSVAAGEFVVLMGPSGSGKSTLLHALAGLQRPSAGRVTIAGVDLWNLSARARTTLRLEQIGLVFQSSDLVPELSLLDNVALPMELAGARRRDSLASAQRALLDLRVDAPTMHRWAGAVSGGQQQRAAVARALGNVPRLLLADEPTGSLDADSRELVLAALAQHAKRGNAVVVATHDPDVLDYGSRVVRIRDGVVQ